MAVIFCQDLKVEEEFQTPDFALTENNFPVSEWMELVCPETAQAQASCQHPYWGKYSAKRKTQIVRN